MTTQVQLMQAGRQRAQAQHRVDAIRRVEAFREWIRAGCPTGRDLPKIPTSDDFRIARQAHR